MSDFQNIEKITTTVLQNPNGLWMQTQNKDGRHPNNANLEAGKASFSPDVDRKFNEGDMNQCTCNDIKTLLRIKVTGNSDDLTITCNGVKAAGSIADLVDGYCRIVNNTNTSFWERARSPMHTFSDSLDKNGKLSTREQSRSYEESQPLSINSQGTSNTESSKFQSEPIICMMGWPKIPRSTKILRYTSFSFPSVK